MPSLGLSALVVAGVFTLSRFAPRVPGPLIAVVGSVAASAAWDFAAHGIAVIGPVASGLPHLTLPDFRWKDIEALMPLAASCFVMIVTQSAATARIYALRHHQRLDENADLIGLSAANGLAAFSGTFVVNGSPTQTAVVESRWRAQPDRANLCCRGGGPGAALFDPSARNICRDACWARSCSSSRSGWWI